MMDYGDYRASDKTFCKRRHWIHVYRIAADQVLLLMVITDILNIL